MAQWINIHWNNNFVNPTLLQFLCKVSGMHTPSTTGSYSRLTGRQADKMQVVKFQNYKICQGLNFLIFAAFDL